MTPLRTRALGWMLALGGLATSAAAPAEAATLKVLGWNDLGMHCMDADYSVFSILPPFNNLHAQVIDTTNNKLLTSGVTVSFEATADLNGSVNSYSVGKTNFWDYSKALFGVDLQPGVGLAGFQTAGMTPQALGFDSGLSMFAAPGVPITPFDDRGVHNTYPMTKVVVRDTGGNALASASVVLPVSDEMTCVACHASGSDADAKPPVHGWVWDLRSPDKDFRRNALALHDDLQMGNKKFVKALKTMGYDPKGLLATADGGRQIGRAHV